MPYFVKIDSKEDLELVKRWVDGWAARCQDNISGYLEYVEPFERLKEAFDNPKFAEKVQLVGVANPEEKPKRQRRPAKAIKAEKREAKKLAPCKEHLTYGALRAPRSDCETCWEAYKRLNGPAKYEFARRKFTKKNSALE